MSDKCPKDGHDADELRPINERKNERKNEQPCETLKAEESDVKEAIKQTPQPAPYLTETATVVDLARQIRPSSEQDITHRIPNLGKRILVSEKYAASSRHQTALKDTGEETGKKAKFDTTEKPFNTQSYLKREPDKPLILKLKETKLVGEKERISTESESSLHKASVVRLRDSKPRGYLPKVALPENTAAQSSSVTTESTASTRQTGKSLEFLFVKDKDGDTPLHIAIVHNESEVARKMILDMVKGKTERRFRFSVSTSGLDIQNNLRQAALHLAVLTCQPLVVKYLAENGADVNAVDRNGQTALHLACKNADLEDVRALRQGVQKFHKKTGANKETMDVNSRNFQGLAPIHLATMTGSCEVVDEILKMGADIDLKDSTSGRTALHHAVEAHNPLVARFLLTHNANVNAQTFAGNTPLHTASGRHMEAIVELLLECGADPKLANAEGDTPLPDTHRLYTRVKRSTKSQEDKTKMSP